MQQTSPNGVPVKECLTQIQIYNKDAVRLKAFKILQKLIQKFMKSSCL